VDIFQALTEEQLLKADSHTKFCSEKVEIEYENAKKFRYAVIDDDSESNQCFSKCFFERSGEFSFYCCVNCLIIKLLKDCDLIHGSFVSISSTVLIEFPFFLPGFMNEEGVMQKDVMFAKLGFEKDEETKAKLSELIEKCTALTGESVCNTAYKVHNCYWSNITPTPAVEPVAA
jgi:hypothetical protein